MRSMENATPPTWRNPWALAFAMRIKRLRAVSPALAREAEHPLLQLILSSPTGIGFLTPWRLKGVSALKLRGLGRLVRPGQRAPLADLWLAGFTFRQLLGIEILRGQWVQIRTRFLAFLVLGCAAILKGFMVDEADVTTESISWVPLGFCAMFVRTVTAPECDATHRINTLLFEIETHDLVGRIRALLHRLWKLLLKAIFLGLVGISIYLAFNWRMENSRDATAFMLLVIATAVQGPLLYIRRSRLAEDFEYAVIDGEHALEQIVRRHAGDTA